MRTASVLILFTIIFLYTSLIKAQTIQEIYETGKKAFYLDSFEEANKSFSEILSLESNNYITCFYKAKIYEINFDNDKAIAELTNAIRMNPKSAEAYFERGTVYDKLEKWSDAVQDYTDAIERNKKYTEAYFNRGSDLQEMKLYHDALNDYTHVVKLNPNDDIAFYNRGLVYLELKETDKAIEDFESAMSIDRIWESELNAKIEALKQGQ